MKVPFTPEIMTKVWRYHAKIEDVKIIAEIVGISEGSVRRIIQIMTAAKNGEDVDSLGGDNHRAQKEFAKMFFGVPKKKEAPVEEKDEAPAENADDTAVLLKAHAAIEYQNELLKKQNEILTKICISLGVEI